MPSHRHRISYLIKRLIASDPSLERFRSGLRAVLTAGILAALFLLVPRLFGVEYKLTLSGILVAVIAAVALQDPGRQQQQITMAWAVPLASAILVLGSLVGNNPWLSGGCFVLVIFIAFQARRWGARGSSLGAIAYQSFFYALLLKTPPDKAQWIPLFVVTGCAVAFAIRFWVVPEHPGRMLHSELRAWRARIGALLHDLARQLERPGKAACKRVQAQLAQLNTQSLGLETRLDGFGDDAPADRLRVQVLKSELAAETLAAVARRAARAGSEARRRLAGELRAFEDLVGSGSAFDEAAWTTKLEQAGGFLPEALRWRLGQAVRILGALPDAHQSLPAMRDEKKPAPAAPSTPSAGDKAGRWLDDTSRRALQASVAALGAILAGHAVSSSHWYWAVFAAFVVFTRTSTVGQTVSGTWRQVLATVAGVCVGIAAAELVHGNRDVELALLFVFIAIGFYAFRGLQNAYVVLLSAMLAMLYELMGMNSPGLLLLRLAETLAGAGAAVLSARFVLPVHTRDESRDKSAALLRAAGRLLRRVWLEPRASADHGAIRELDRKLQALRQTLGPVTGADYPGAKQNRRRHLQRLSRIVYCIRHCCALAVDLSPERIRTAPLHQATSLLAPRLDDTAALFEDTPEPPRTAPAEPPICIPDDGPAPNRVAARWLADTDAILRAMRDRLGGQDPT